MLIKICLICIFSFIVGASLYFLIHPTVNESSLEKISNYIQCNNLSLEETADCLRSYVLTFYNYTIRSDKIRSIEDIKKNGGDCYDYNMLYKRLSEELGFVTYDFRIKIGEDSHRIAIITDETGYCLMDQRHKPDCFRGGIINEE